MIDNKIVVLKKLATLFNKHSITWNVGASCMLYLRNIIDDFNDIDIMISLEDVSLVKELLKEFHLEEKQPTTKYKTKVFLEYVIDSVEIDIMAGFLIVKDDNEFYFPLQKGLEMEQINIDNCPVNLESTHNWLKYYDLMGRDDKVAIIKEHMKKI
ncbi:hypothetical protein CI105_06255 [Candidatus Izimaplasma bacterium ZiA1]|uniref:hypothetical protein n=1 Tax=Candidatus Izimoplasma sp. ZiA1 TaxID=2024899 RepID=UPI000BAA57BB|nr:hypothetical protein CI105_06255 [Candidatus Izimaplasma bacterium ZiA1]